MGSLCRPGLSGEVQMKLGEAALDRQTILAGLQLAQRTGSVPTVLAALLDLSDVAGDRSSRRSLAADCRCAATSGQNLWQKGRQQIGKAVMNKQRVVPYMVGNLLLITAILLTR